MHPESMLPFTTEDDILKWHLNRIFNVVWTKILSGIISPTMTFQPPWMIDPQGHFRCFICTTYCSFIPHLLVLIFLWKFYFHSSKGQGKQMRQWVASVSTHLCWLTNACSLWTLPYSEYNMALSRHSVLVLAVVIPVREMTSTAVPNTSSSIDITTLCTTLVLFHWVVCL